jgi:cystathionine beta-synthase
MTLQVSRPPVPAPPRVGRGLLPLIGNTPLVEITKLDAGSSRLFLKLESANPGGSIKDRPALAMVEAAERAGHLLPGGLIVEATAGNTGLGLALVAAAKGYKLTLVIPDKMSREKISHLRAMGAEVGLDPVRCRQGPSRLLSGQGAAHRSGDARRHFHQPV